MHADKVLSANPLGVFIKFYYCITWIIDINSCLDESDSFVTHLRHNTEVVIYFIAEWKEKRDLKEIGKIIW